MAKLTAGAGGIIIDDGVYDATLLSIEETAATPNSPNKNPWFKWLFQVYDSDEGQEMSAASSMAFGSKTKARKWVEALLGKKLELGEEIETDTLCPKDCQVVVKNNPDSGFARIEDVLGQRRQRSASTRPSFAPGTTKTPARPKEQQGGVVVSDDEGTLV